MTHPDIFTDMGGHAAMTVVIVLAVVLFLALRVWAALCERGSSRAENDVREAIAWLLPLVFLLLGYYWVHSPFLK